MRARKDHNDKPESNRSGAIRSLCLALILVFSQAGRAFVFYPVGSGFLKWNLNSPLLSTNVVNPATKAIRYFIASDAYSNANRDKEINAIRACFDQWQSVPGCQLRFEFAGLVSPDGLDLRYDNRNVVFWAKKTLLVNGGAENLSGRRAWTSVNFANDGSILDADIVLNGIQYTWFTDFNDTINQAQFIEAIALHEVGHFLGLDHSPAGGATVKDAGNGISTDTGLSADEIAAARFFYGNAPTATIQGTVRINGGILGAAVIAEDASGNIAGATVTQASGRYAIYGLNAGTYQVRVTPLDPAGSGSNSLMRGDEVAADYADAETGFLPSPNVAVTVAQSETRTQDFTVIPGNPLRITSISQPTTIPNLVSIFRYAVSLRQGQSNWFVGVSSAGFSPSATLSITGSGLTLGPTTFAANSPAPGINSLSAAISVSSNAVPGLRSFVVIDNGRTAYANGYLEIASPVPDYNFDGLDDRFQRQYWPLWTAPEAAPAADADGDGFSNRFEFRTGTDPINPLSNKLVIGPLLRDRFGRRITWLADPGATYRVSSRTAWGAPWSPVGAPVQAIDEVVSFQITFSQPAEFFRLELLR